MSRSNQSRRPHQLPCPGRCNVVLVGGGGREHAIAWKLKQSSRLGQLWLTDPGNGGLSRLGKPCPRKLDLKHPFHFERWCDEQDINLIVVGPEAPLAEGVVDTLRTDRRMVFGPTREAAQLEADKAFAKSLMRQAAVPTAESRSFTDLDAALRYLDAHEGACVVKAAGLAAGKGVVVCDDADQARQAVREILRDAKFGDAGAKVLIEERLSGQELSVLALVDGRTIWVLDPCQDHKQVGEGDAGPNTGGMGAYCPTPLAEQTSGEDGENLMAVVEREILVPTVDALRRNGIEYRGVLYAGLMLTPAGPKVLEFNCRFGDPECQPLMARWRGDLIEALWATCTSTLGSLNAQTITFDPRVACCVVMCSAGYPGAYEKGKPITGIDDAVALGSDQTPVHVFHAGTTYNHEGTLVTHGGRVLGVTALAPTLLEARDLANAACEKIHFDGAFYRHDIGHRVLDNAVSQ